MDRLRTDVAALRAEVARWGAATYRHWRPRIARRRFAPAALNLAHYLALRRHELRHLQTALMPLGLSSLGRSESRVLASLDAIGAALAALGGDREGVRPMSQRRFRRGERLGAEAADAILGPERPGRTGRILVTLPPEAARDAALLDALVAAGTDAVRIDCARDDPDRWARLIEALRAAGRRAGRRPRIVMTLGGPRIRTAEIVDQEGRERIRQGDAILLRRAGALPDPAIPFALASTRPDALERLAVGDPFVVDGGKIRGRIQREKAGNLVGTITEAPIKGHRLKPGRDLHFPGVDLRLDPLTPEDLDHLPFVAAQADMIGLSQASIADHVAQVQETIARTGAARPVGLLLAVETRRALRNLPDLLVQAAGRQPTAVSIARGDLAIEIGIDELAQAQEELFRLCEAASIPVVWTAQALDALVRKGAPSRGEMADAALVTRAACAMLTRGPNVAAGVAALDGLMRRDAPDRAPPPLPAEQPTERLAPTG